MKIRCHYDGVSTRCRNGGDIHLQEFRRVGRTIVLFRQVRPELGWPGRCAEMIRECGAAQADQGDTRLESGAHWGLRCYRSTVLIKVATLDVLPVLTRPF
jgi:hypothetical protein